MITKIIMQDNFFFKKLNKRSTASDEIEAVLFSYLLFSIHKSESKIMDSDRGPNSITQKPMSW